VLPGTYEARSLDTGATAVVELEGRQKGRVARDRIVTFIAAYWARYGWAPTRDDVAEGVGLASSSGLTTHIEQLVAAGRIRHIPGSPRSLRVVER
jgi:SOS-response transcriptional repressor LexA